MKILIFDSGPLISFAMNALLDEFKSLKKSFNGKFIITSEVKREIIDRPLTIKRFELEALQIKELLDEGILEMPKSLGISDDEISRLAKKVLEVANNTFFEKQNPIHLIEDGEASCLALSKLLSEKKIQNVIAVDERTTRVLCEKPENLRNLLKEKFHSSIEAKKENYKFFSDFRIIRSSELVYIAWKKNLTRLKGNVVLDAMLYGVKLRGCSISDDEINTIKNM